MKLNDILDELKRLEKLGLNKDSFVIVYGAALVIQGVRKETHDLDLQCINDDKFDELSRSGFEVNKLKHNGVLQIHLTELTDLHKGKLATDIRWEDRFGYNVQTVESVLEEKKNRGREKDKEDIELIEKFLLLGNLVVKPWEKVTPLREIMSDPHSSSNVKETLEKLLSAFIKEDLENWGINSSGEPMMLDFDSGIKPVLDYLKKEVQIYYKGGMLQDWDEEAILSNSPAIVDLNEQPDFPIKDNLNSTIYKITTEFEFKTHFLPFTADFEVKNNSIPPNAEIVRLYCKIGSSNISGTTSRERWIGSILDEMLSRKKSICTAWFRLNWRNENEYSAEFLIIGMIRGYYPAMPVFDYINRVNSPRADKLNPQQMQKIIEELKGYASKYPTDQKSEHNKLEDKKNTVGCGESYIVYDKDETSIYPNWKRSFDVGKEIKVTMLKRRDENGKNNNEQ